MWHPLVRTDSKNVEVGKRYSANQCHLGLGDGSDLIHPELDTAAQRAAGTELLHCLQVASFPTPGLPTTSQG